MNERAVSVAHEYVGGPYGGFVLLPLGLRLNRDVEEAVVGSMLEFSGGERARLLCVKRLACNDALTSGLATIRYGLNMIELRKRWCRESVLSGAGLKAIDNSVCLAVFYERKVAV